eukprot:SAG31_NODE_244_length_19246_cov_20.233823_7_plen_157_part_00
MSQFATDSAELMPFLARTGFGDCYIALLTSGVIGEDASCRTQAGCNHPLFFCAGYGPPQNRTGHCNSCINNCFGLNPYERTREKVDAIGGEPCREVCDAKAKAAKAAKRDFRESNRKVKVDAAVTIAAEPDALIEGTQERLDFEAGAQCSSTLQLY